MLIFLIFGFFAFWMSVLTILSFLRDRMALRSRSEANSSLGIETSLGVNSSSVVLSSSATRTNLREEKGISLLPNPSFGITAPTKLAPTQQVQALEPSAAPRKRSEGKQAFQDLWIEISKGA